MDWTFDPERLFLTRLINMQRGRVVWASLREPGSQPCRWEVDPTLTQALRAFDASPLPDHLRFSPHADPLDSLRILAPTLCNALDFVVQSQFTQFSSSIVSTDANGMEGWVDAPKHRVNTHNTQMRAVLAYWMQL
ncbi:hypothetical protein R1flu_019193 [Riccia fluitans]|uniref:Uncharacterized protein n=1 Tax=Riccia fluitans TaxID=41844 RepID=A0ABD1ZJG6_9MARC